MKYWYFTILIVALGVTSCEDVIELDVPTGQTRLIVDALIRVDTTQEFLGLKVKVTETNNFFEEVPVTSLESIVVIYTTTREDGLVLDTGTGVSSLIDVDTGSGIYIPNPDFSTEQRISTNVVQQENDVLFTLILEHKGRKYGAQTRYAPLYSSSQFISGFGNPFRRR